MGRNTNDGELKRQRRVVRELAAGRRIPSLVEDMDERWTRPGVMHGAPADEREALKHGPIERFPRPGDDEEAATESTRSKHMNDTPPPAGAIITCQKPAVFKLSAIGAKTRAGKEIKTGTSKKFALPKDFPELADGLEFDVEIRINGIFLRPVSLRENKAPTPVALPAWATRMK